MVGRPSRAVRNARTRGALATLACLLGLALAVGACGDDGTTGGAPGGSAAKDTIAFGTDPTYAPLEFKDGAKLAGAEVELMGAVAQLLGAKATWVTGDFATLVPSLKAGRFDAIAAGMLDVPERRNDVLFVDALANPGLGALFANADTPPSADPRSLCDMSVAVGKGTGIADGADPALPKLTQGVCPAPVKVLIMPNEPAAQLAVQAGRADAFMTSYMSVAYIAKTAGGGTTFRAVQYQRRAGQRSGQFDAPIAIGVRAGDTELADRIKGALEHLIADGTYRAILARYGIEAMAVDQPTINGAS